MRQILQELKSGRTFLADVPRPRPAPGSVLVATRRSLISAGTERMLIEFGRDNLAGKIRRQPGRVAEVLARMRTDGIAATMEAVEAKLSTPLQLGYCNVGVVASAGEGFAAGERVVSNGHHGEFVSVPRNLVARVPDSVDDESAAFTVLGAIALQGVRLAGPTIGERFVVIGLGAIGLLAVQILRANGCRVLGIDPNPQRRELARRFGAEIHDPSQGLDPVRATRAFAGAAGVDGVLVAASTKSHEPVSQAARMCRKRGRIVLLGVAGLDLKREDFYEKELSFQVSCSYGPGRYDPEYETNGHDYPIGFVRWTQGRNFEAVLDLMADGRLDVAPLITHRFEMEEVEAAYRTLLEDPSALGILFGYPPIADEPDATIAIAEGRGTEPAGATSNGEAAVSFVGAGNHAGRFLADAFHAAGARLVTAASPSGVSARHLAVRFGFASASSDVPATIADPAANILAIATRHDSHAELVLQALHEGRHVFVEKPLCLTTGELETILAAAKHRPARILMVGFNRRFAPLAVKMRAAVETIVEPKLLTIHVNAGEIPDDHWLHDPKIGGGRLLGEACHFVDLSRFLIGRPIEDVSVVPFETGARRRAPAGAVVTLRHEDGSVATIQYFANGPKTMAKERVELVTAGRALCIENFRKLDASNWPGLRSSRSWRQDKGQKACVARFVEAVRTGAAAPIPLSEIAEVSRWSIEIAKQAG